MNMVFLSEKTVVFSSKYIFDKKSQIKFVLFHPPVL